jgi:hypothetical protein
MLRDHEKRVYWPGAGDLVVGRPPGRGERFVITVVFRVREHRKTTVITKLRGGLAG